MHLQSRMMSVGNMMFKITKFNTSWFLDAADVFNQHVSLSNM